jgi:hypothetical protein
VECAAAVAEDAATPTDGVVALEPASPELAVAVVNPGLDSEAMLISAPLCAKILDSEPPDFETLDVS